MLQVLRVLRTSGLCTEYCGDCEYSQYFEVFALLWILPDSQCFGGSLLLWITNSLCASRYFGVLYCGYCNFRPLGARVLRVPAVTKYSQYAQYTPTITGTPPC